MPAVFEWDRHKARFNLEKHRVSFAEVATVFQDPLARIFADQDHSGGIPRDYHRSFVARQTSLGVFH